MGVTQKTVSNRVSNFGEVPKLLTEPTLLDQSVLDEIARKIREEAKTEVLPEVREALRQDPGLRGWSIPRQSNAAPCAASLCRSSPKVVRRHMHGIRG